jgi:PAS domain S-box-containing protein
MTHRRLSVYPVAALVYVATVSFIDWLTPTVLDAWVLSLPVVLVPIWLNARRDILPTATLCSIFILFDAVFIAHPNNAHEFVLKNIGVGLATLWLAALGGIMIVQRTNELVHKSASLAVSEERLRLAMEGAGMGTWDRDLQTDISVWSDTHFRMLGYAPTPDGKAPVQMWRSLVHPDDAENVLEAEERARKDNTLFCAEYRIVRADTGEVAWLSIVGRIRYNNAGEAVRFLGVSFDVSRRKKLEREVLDIATEQQRRIGHELHDSVGQELTGLGLMANSLTQSLTKGSSERKIVNRLIAGLDRVRLQVRNLSRGLAPVEMENKGFWAALDTLAARTRVQSGIDVRFDCPENVEMPSHESATELFHIAQEALSNALRHGNAHHIRMSLLPEPKGLCLQVHDDGIGMPPRDMLNCGGMGLQIMRYRAKQIGATLQVDSASESGTTITCVLRNASTREVDRERLKTS